MRRLHTTAHGVRGDRMAVLLINDLQISLSPASWVAMRFIIIITLDNVTLRSPRWQLKSICILCFPISMRQFHLNVSSESRNYRYIVWWRMKISLRSEFRRRKEKNKFWVAYLIRPHFLIPIPFGVRWVFNNHKMHFDAAIIRMSKWPGVIPKLCINKMEMQLKASICVWALLHSSLTQTHFLTTVSSLRDQCHRRPTEMNASALRRRGAWTQLCLVFLFAFATSQSLLARA